VFFTGMTPTFFGLFRHVFDSPTFCRANGGCMQKRRASPTFCGGRVEETSGKPDVEIDEGSRNVGRGPTSREV
jgi:hypothetical protein